MTRPGIEAGPLNDPQLPRPTHSNNSHLWSGYHVSMTDKSTLDILAHLIFTKALLK